MVKRVTEEDVKRLSQRNKELVQMYDFAIEDASNKEYIIEDVMGIGDATIMERMKQEIAIEAIDAVVTYMKAQREELIVSFLDDQGCDNDEQQ